MGKLVFLYRKRPISKECVAVLIELHKNTVSVSCVEFDILLSGHFMQPVHASRRISTWITIDHGQILIKTAIYSSRIGPLWNFHNKDFFILVN